MSVSVRGREVLFDPGVDQGAGVVHRLAAVRSLEHEDRAAVVVGAVAADETGLLHPVDDAGEAALAVAASSATRPSRFAQSGSHVDRGSTGPLVGGPWRR